MKQHIFNFNTTETTEKDVGELQQSEAIVEITVNKDGTTSKSFKDPFLDRFTPLLTDDSAEGRRSQRGESLSKDYGDRNVLVLRASTAKTNTFKPMDYVLVKPTGGISPSVYAMMKDYLTGDFNPRTEQQKLVSWVASHAQTMSLTCGGDYHVMVALVPASDVYHATNTGEYFYDGDIKEGKVVFGVDEYGEYYSSEKTKDSENKMSL